MTTTLNASRDVPGQLGEFEMTVLSSLYRHRLLTTSQIATLHEPRGQRRWVQRRLRRLEHIGYIARVRGRPPAREARWYVTGLGADLAEAGKDVSVRDYRMDAHRATSRAAAHLLAVNDVGVALTVAARVSGDEFDHRSWEHEIPHRTGEKRTSVVRPDAVLTYDVWDDGGVSSHWRFLELDRGTESVHALIEKLRAYTAVHRYAPPRRDGNRHLPKVGWRRRYPVWPGILFVFAGLDDLQVERRLETLAGFWEADPVLRVADQLRVTAVSLDRLQREGPFVPCGHRLPSLERTCVVSRGL